MNKFQYFNETLVHIRVLLKKAFGIYKNFEVSNFFVKIFENLLRIKRRSKKLIEY